MDHPPIALQEAVDERPAPSCRRSFLERLDRLVALGVLEDSFAIPREFGFDRDAEVVSSVLEPIERIEK